MSTFDQIIQHRRSIRKYDAARTISREEIEMLVRAAQEAPSWKNLQATRYYVALGSEMVNRVRPCLENSNPMKTEGAGAIIVSTFVRNIVGFSHGEPDNEGGNGWGWYDMGLQNALLLTKAAEADIDTLVIGLRRESELRQFFHIPEDEIIGPVIAVGHRVENAKRPPRKELADILFIHADN